MAIDIHRVSTTHDCSIDEERGCRKKIDKFLVVSIDCWRYDALSRTNPRINTPKFDLLTRDYAFAERYFVTAPATRPSHTSLFTGCILLNTGFLGRPT